MTNEMITAKMELGNVLTCVADAYWAARNL